MDIGVCLELLSPEETIFKGKPKERLAKLKPYVSPLETKADGLDELTYREMMKEELVKGIVKYQRDQTNREEYSEHMLELRRADKEAKVIKANAAPEVKVEEVSAQELPFLDVSPFLKFLHLFNNLADQRMALYA